jgi:hypothetical protein
MLARLGARRRAHAITLHVGADVPARARRRHCRASDAWRGRARQPGCLHGGGACARAWRPSGRRGHDRRASLERAAAGVCAGAFDAETRISSLPGTGFASSTRCSRTSTCRRSTLLMLVTAFGGIDTVLEGIVMRSRTHTVFSATAMRCSWNRRPAHA